IPSVLHQPTRSPASRPKWAISLVTVVLPLVPVTATTGMRGTGSAGGGSGSTLRRSRPARSIRAARSGSSTAATSRSVARPSATASSRRGHGQATITSPSPGPRRPRTGSRAMPASAATRRTRWAASRAAKRSRRSLEDELYRGSGEPAVGPFQDAQVSRGHAGHYTWRPMDPRTDPAGLLPLANARSERTLASLELLVNRDSGSYSADGVNRVADLCEERLRSGGWTVERVTPRPGAGEAQLGDLVIGRRQGARPVEAGGRRLLLMAHMDTVFDDGTAAARPFRVEGGRAYGPGVADDKCGLVAGIEAVEVLCDEAAFDDFAGITLACTPDEEIGSPFSKDLLTRLAGEHEIGVGLEAARVNGALVTSRKGISALEIGIQGKAVHAGVRPKEGINAALEAARKAEALQALNDRWQGVTCNVGVIRAGTRPNVVAERAELQLDLRAVTAVDFERALAAVREI